MDEYFDFCFKCGWNDSDFGCTCPPNEEVYQCPLYIDSHPEEVQLFNKSFEDWCKSKK